MDILIQLPKSHACVYIGNPGPVLRRGPHWQALGFQGDDPATDLRGAGVLGLLQLLHFAVTAAGSAAAAVMECTSRTATEVPLALLSFNATAWSCQALRRGALHTRSMSTAGEVLRIVNRLHSNILCEFYRRWVMMHCGRAVPPPFSTHAQHKMGLQGQEAI